MELLRQYSGTAKDPHIPFLTNPVPAGVTRRGGAEKCGGGSAN